MTFYDVVQCPVEFNTDAGKIVVHDGCAAGESWLLVEFLEGKLAGKKIWMGNDELSASYMGHCCDDGFLFNMDPARGPHTGCIHDPDGYTVMDGGEYIKDLEGFEVNIVGLD